MGDDVMVGQKERAILYYLGMSDGLLLGIFCSSSTKGWDWELIFTLWHSVLLRDAFWRPV